MNINVDTNEKLLMHVGEGDPSLVREVSIQTPNGNSITLFGRSRVLQEICRALANALESGEETHYTTKNSLGRGKRR
jgi:hypothetical protein